MKNPIDTYTRAAAVLALRKLLSGKHKGDHITAREVLEATGQPVTEFRGPIHTWAKHANVVVKAVPGDGYRVLEDREHTDAARRKAKSGERSEKEALRELVVTDHSKLDAEQARRLEYMLPRQAARTARAVQDAKDVAQEFKLLESRVPLRIAGEQKDSAG